MASQPPSPDSHEHRYRAVGVACRLWPGWCSMRTAVTSLLALSIVGFSGWVLYPPLTKGTLDGIQIAEGIVALLGPTVGIVIGYYFGSANGERLADRASQAVARAAVDTADIEQKSTSALALADDEIDAARNLLVQFLMEQGQEAQGESDGAGDEEPQDDSP